MLQSNKRNYKYLNRISNNNNNKKIKLKRNSNFQTNTAKKHLTIGLININSINNKEKEIQNFLSKKIDGTGKIDILGLTDTRHQVNDRTINKHVMFALDLKVTPNEHSGTAALVSPELAPYTSIIDKISTPSVLWLQITTTNKQLFIAICYCNPTNTNLLNDTLKNLLENYALFSNIGQVCMMGDFNGRLGNITGDSITNMRGNLIKEATHKGNLRILQSNQQLKWTFYHPINNTTQDKGRSIPDIVIVPKLEKTKFTHYQVHSTITIGSDGHRLITFNWQIGLYAPQSHDWGTRQSPVINWDKKTQLQYNLQVEQEMKKHNANPLAQQNYNTARNNQYTKNYQKCPSTIHTDTQEQE
jgi:hypothetical protein